MATERHYSPIDRLLLQADSAMRTLLPSSGHSRRPSPAVVQTDHKMSDVDSRHVAGLMRINHTGEVCAQALYQGQALTAKLPKVRKAMEHAAEEEIDIWSGANNASINWAVTPACPTRCSTVCHSEWERRPVSSATG